MSNEETKVRELVERYAQGVRTKDVKALTALYAKDVLSYDLVGPLERRGVEEVLRRTQEWFSSFEGPIGYEVKNLKVDAGENVDIAFLHSLDSVSGRTKDGREVRMWIRLTVGLRKIAGDWRITHEHVSVPFDMKTMKAELDLQPEARR